MKSYTDLKQSKKLAEILPIESADLWWNETKNYPEFIKTYHEYLSVSIPPIPCWSLAALIEVLPRSIEFKDDTYYLRFMKDYVEYVNDAVSITGRCLHTTGNNNLVDACVEMIIKLHEQKFL